MLVYYWFIELQYFATQVNIMLFFWGAVFEIRQFFFHRNVWAKFPIEEVRRNMGLKIWYTT